MAGGSLSSCAWLHLWSAEEDPAETGGTLTRANQLSRATGVVQHDETFNMI